MAKASGVDLESGSGRVTQWRYEGRLTTASDRMSTVSDRMSTVWIEKSGI